MEVFESKSRVGSSAGGHTEGIRNYLGRDGLEDLARFGIKVQPFAVAQRVVRRSRKFISVVHGPSYYLVDRGGGPVSLERQLLDQALDAGVQVRFKAKADPAGVDVWATGAPREKVNIVAAGYRFNHEGSKLEGDAIHALFDNDLAPGGYLCILPGPRWHSIYSVSWRSMPYADLLAKVRRALKIPWVQEILGSSERVGKIYGKGYFHPNPYQVAVEGDVKKAGESAGIQDAVGGFGVRYAIASGVLAARSCLEGSDYVSLLRDEFRDEFEIGLKSRDWLDRATDEDYDRLVERLGPEVGVGDYASWRTTRFM